MEIDWTEEQQEQKKEYVFVPMPGIHAVTVESVTETPFDEQGRQDIKVVYRIVGGQFDGKAIVEFFNFSSKPHLNWLPKKLRNLCTACGEPRINHTSQLTDRALRIKVAVNQEWNNISWYFPIDNKPAPVAPAPKPPAQEVASKFATEELPF